MESSLLQVNPFYFSLYLVFVLNAHLLFMNKYLINSVKQMHTIPQIMNFFNKILLQTHEY